MNKNKVKVFYSYSHKDEILKEEFESHMSGLKRKGLIEEWHDRKIIPGQKWEDQISSNIEDAHIVLFLVSSDFIASEYCYNIEVLKSVERHNSGKCIVVPVILRECDWEGTPFESIQGLPTDMKPIKSRHWHDKDEAFTDTVKGLKKIIEMKFEELNGSDFSSFTGEEVNTREFLRIKYRFLDTGEEFFAGNHKSISVNEDIRQLFDDEILDGISKFTFILKRTNKEIDGALSYEGNGVMDGDTILVIGEGRRM